MLKNPVSLFMFPRQRTWLILIGCGLLLLGGHFLFHFKSADLAEGENSWFGSTSVDHTLLWLAIGLPYLLAVVATIRASLNRYAMAWILAIGLLLRLSVMFSTPVDETDYYRYLWDGGLAAHGINPFLYAPQSVIDEDPDLSDQVITLGRDAGETLRKVNHPQLRTVYPLVAQAAFAIAYKIQPWSLGTLRFVYFLADIATLLLLFALLHQMRRPTAWILIYWWSPLFTNEVVNSAHMDILLLPFLLGVLYCAIKNKSKTASVLLAFATAVKVWPILFFPLLLRPLLGRWKTFLSTLFIYGALCTILFYPMLNSKLESSDSGMTSYVKKWQMNDSLYMLVNGSAKIVLRSNQFESLIGHKVENSFNIAHIFSRLLCVAALSILILLLCLKPATDSEDWCKKMRWIVLLLFLISPTQFPWYCLWLLPFATLQPRPSLLLLFSLMPIYYLRFHFKDNDQVAIFDNGLVWLQYLPVYLLLIREAWQHKRSLTQRKTEDF